MADKIVSEEEVKKIVANCKEIEEDVAIKDYLVYHASDKMLGFLGEYWKLEIELSASANKKIYKRFFIKSICKSNVAKANMVREMNLFEKELWFFTVMKNNMGNSNIEPWCAKFITSINEAMVFDDLSALQYKTRNKFKVYDEEHTLLALNTLARFHASSLIYEEGKCKQLQKTIDENYLTDKGGYTKCNTWFLQCMKGSLDIIKTMSKYKNNAEALRQIENNWQEVWYQSLEINNNSNKYRNVICHRDLWNNNIMFRYETFNNTVKAVDCLFVDFAAVSYQPPASDVMLLLYCTLDPIFREENLNYFLNYYYEQLKNILSSNGITIADVILYRDFIKSSEEQRLWGVIISACLVPQFWIDEELTKEIFCNTDEFERILNNDKAAFIKTMMNNDGYKHKVMQIFEEIAERYCLNE